MSSFRGAEKGTGRLMPMAKKQNHPKGGTVQGGMGTTPLPQAMKESSKGPSTEDRKRRLARGGV